MLGGERANERKWLKTKLTQSIFARRSLARIFMPIMSGTVSEYYGNSYVFCCLVVVLAVALMAVLFTRRTLGVLSGAIS